MRGDGYKFTTMTKAAKKAKSFDKANVEEQIGLLFLSIFDSNCTGGNLPARTEKATLIRASLVCP